MDKKQLLLEIVDELDRRFGAPQVVRWITRARIEGLSEAEVEMVIRIIASKICRASS